MFREVNLISPIVSVSLRFVIISATKFYPSDDADMLPTTLCSSRFELLMRWLRLPALTHCGLSCR